MILKLIENETKIGRVATVTLTVTTTQFASTPTKITQLRNTIQ